MFRCLPSRRTHPLAVWLTLLALLWGALAPTVAQALVARQPQGQWIEICQASGMAWVRTDDTPPATREGTHPLLDSTQHCGWCQLHGGASGLPPAATAWSPPPAQPSVPLSSTARHSIGTAIDGVQARAPPCRA